MSYERCVVLYWMTFERMCRVHWLLLKLAGLFPSLEAFVEEYIQLLVEVYIILRIIFLPMSLTVLVFSYPYECSKWVILAFFFHEWNIRGLFLVMPKWRNFIYFLFFTRHCEPGGLFFTKLSWFYMVFKAVVVFNWLLQTCMCLRSFARYLCLRARSPHSFGFCKVDSLIFLLS